MLDPQVARILEGVNRGGGARWHELGVTAAREHYARSVVMLERPPLPMHEIHDLEIVLPDRRVAVRQYVPIAHAWAQPQPALLFFHGGGFTIGSIQTHDRLARALAHEGRCHVFSVEYRLAPEHRFPAAVDDAFAALDWLLAQAEVLGVDRSRIAVGGDSAGGTLAAATAIHARDRGIALRLQLLLYPGLSARQDTQSHRRFARGYLVDDDVVQWFFGHYLRDDADRDDWRFAPLLAPRLERVAPTWLALAEYDPLVDEGQAYARRLSQAGVPVQCTVFAGMAHSFFQHAGFVTAARRAQAQAGLALRRAFDIEE